MYRQGLCITKDWSSCVCGILHGILVLGCYVTMETQSYCVFLVITNCISSLHCMLALVLT